MSRLMCLILVLGFSCGCSGVVYSTLPIGGEVRRIDASQWDGVWRIEDGSDEIRFQVVDADGGALLLISTQDDAPASERLTAFVRQHADLTFVSIACIDRSCDTGKGVVDRYLWVVAAMHEDTMLVWIPHADAFEALVDQDLLPGERDGSDVLLHPLEDRHYDLFDAQDHGTLLDWRHPLIFKRIA